MAGERKIPHKRKHIRRVASYLAAILFGLVVLGPVGEFFIELARAWGLYDAPEETARGVMTAFNAVVTSTAFLCLTTFAVGLALGTWLDLFLARQERTALAGTDQAKGSLSGSSFAPMENVKLDPAIQALLDNIAWL